MTVDYIKYAIALAAVASVAQAEGLPPPNKACLLVTPEEASQATGYTFWVPYAVSETGDENVWGSRCLLEFQADAKGKHAIDIWVNRWESTDKAHGVHSSGRKPSAETHVDYHDVPGVGEDAYFVTEVGVVPGDGDGESLDIVQGRYTLVIDGTPQPPDNPGTPLSNEIALAKIILAKLPKD